MLKPSYRTLCFASLLVANSSLAAEVTELEWMSGCWSLEGGEAGSGEMWTRPMGNMLFGIGHITGDGVVNFYEYMRIEKRASGELYLVAQPSNQSGGEFKMTEMEQRRVVFENPAHDFPQRITYWIESEGIMKAKVEAQEAGVFQGFELTLLQQECNNQ